MSEFTERLCALSESAAVVAPRPKQVRPILSIGAGGIVRDAHQPAYQKAGFPVLAVTDLNFERAQGLARQFGIEHAFARLEDLVAFAPPQAVFDIAVPALELTRILTQLPDGATVLMQKPMGETLDQAREIRSICREKHLTAAVNFAQRYTPSNLVLKAMYEAGELGEIHDLQVQVRVATPWHLWSFLSTAPRLEILYHSIHYFDLIRSWLGNPRGVFARTVKDPLYGSLAATKTTAILDYGDSTRVLVATHHGHNFGGHFQDSYIQIEGTKAAARMKMGVLLNYPKGEPDTLEIAERGKDQWTSVPLSGNNFPDGFLGTMGALQAFAEGSLAALPSNFEDAFETMELVEALYASSRSPAFPIRLE